MTGSPNSKLTANIIAILGAFLICAGLVAAMWHYSLPAPLGEDRVVTRKKALAEVRAADAEQLKNYGWVDPTKDLVRLPIAEAMKLALRNGQNPEQARSNLISRVEKAYPAPKSPEKTNKYD